MGRKVIVAKAVGVFILYIGRIRFVINKLEKQLDDDKIIKDWHSLFLFNNVLIVTWFWSHSIRYGIKKRDTKRIDCWAVWGRTSNNKSGKKDSSDTAGKDGFNISHAYFHIYFSCRVILGLSYDMASQNKSGLVPGSFRHPTQWIIRIRFQGISGGAVKCVEIGKNTNGESTLLGRHWHWETKARGANGIRYPSSPSRKRWILGAVRIDPCSAVANVLSIPPGEYVRKNETPFFAFSPSYF